MNENAGKQKALPCGKADLSSFVRSGRLDNVCGLRAACALDDVELDVLPLVERLETFILDGGEMNEHIVAVLASDESISLFCAEPFYFADHGDSS